MEFQVNKGIVKHGEAYYRRGSFFNAEKSDVDHLIQSGVVIPSNSDSLEGDNQFDENPNMIDNPKDSDDAEIEAPTVEEFEELKADEQKQILMDIGIEPASNKEDRLTQYTEWYESEEEGGENEV